MKRAGSACGNDAVHCDCHGLRLPNSGQTTPDQTTPMRVVSASYPLAYLAQRIGGEQVTVQNLTQPGAEPHDLELRPKQIAAVADADAVGYEKGFSPLLIRPFDPRIVRQA